jgi:hypothetical protein
MGQLIRPSTEVSTLRLAAGEPLSQSRRTGFVIWRHVGGRRFRSVRLSRVLQVGKDLSSDLRDETEGPVRYRDELKRFAQRRRAERATPEPVFQAFGQPLETRGRHRLCPRVPRSE